MKRIPSWIIYFGIALLLVALMYVASQYLVVLIIPKPADLVELYLGEIKPGTDRAQVRQMVSQATNLCTEDQITSPGDDNIYAIDSFGFRGDNDDATRGLIVKYVMSGTTYVVSSVAKTDNSMLVANAELMKCPDITWRP